MYPKGSPKYNLMKATGKKAILTKIKKTPSKVKKPRPQWNPALEKALVDLLHEHNSPYHRGQNGWSAESWNRMKTIFHERYSHTNSTKQQIQDKQKELKSQYKLIKDARKQSGVSWNYHTHMIDADPRLWQNLITSWPDISKFQTKPFPLYDKLGDLYDGHIAEGSYNFTSIEATQVIDDDPEVEIDETAFSFDLNQCEDDLQMYDDPRDAAAPGGSKDYTQSDVTQASAPSGSNKKPLKEPKKKKRDDPMVEVMANYVEIKRKQAEEESALFAGSKNAQQFIITKCIAVLHKMESISHGERAAAYKVFKNAENREIFLNAAAEDEVSAAVYLRSEMADLPRGI